MLNNRFLQLLSWELRNIIGRISNIFAIVLFFIITVMLFPFAIGIAGTILEASSSGIIWVCALLAIQLSYFDLIERDYRDGSLEQ